MRGPHVAFILLVVIWALIAVEVSQPSEKIHCFSKVPVNVSGIKPPIVSGPGFPPEAGFKGITLDEVVNGSPRHVLVGFFNFKPLNWTEKKPKCYFKRLEGFSENWIGFVLPGASTESITLSSKVYLALYVYPKETSVVISKIEYAENPEDSKIVEAFRLEYPKNPEEYVAEYLDSLEKAGYTKVRELKKGAIFERDDDTLLALEIEDDANFYLILVKGSHEDVLRVAEILSEG
ncbi:hypothetical protein TK1133 [Thermococcus kodakarensis KOD1]|uniref:Uncharacterized protein n=1 Tax=Thermococcus kodakarensis (strain ATCC BAA-918 / JCM 12380 / KOD1) TaxID=69014 RepID=Q5JE82_THEKO|nr:hypothetical protein TK1133 [Thermococcus kodakarensis KOD1]